MPAIGFNNLIQIRGARENNLKDLSLDIPRNQLVVITGPSGSGKSTLAFDTIFAEGQRRYIESLSAYAKQFVEQLKKPDVDSIRGLCPAIAIQQKGILKNPRSTVGTLTEIYDFLRLLFSRVGDPHCPQCQVPISTQTQAQIVEQILDLKPGTKLNVMAVVARRKKGEFAQELDDLARLGIIRARINGQDVSLGRGMKLEKQKPHSIEAYIDRLILKDDVGSRVSEAVALAAQFGKGQVQVELFETGEVLLFNQSLGCPSCGKGFPEMSPRLFSFNSPLGACKECNGLGYFYEEEPSEDDEAQAAIASAERCVACDGSRLRPEPRSVFIHGRSIADLSAFSMDELDRCLRSFVFEGRKAIVSEKILKEIIERVSFLKQVGLHYLSLDRRATTLSGGEEQRVRLATQIGSKLTGVLYVLDEPSIGLHQADNQKLIEALIDLRNHGNSVLVVEHDLDTMLAADQIIDLGPGAGRAGGHLIEQAKPLQMKEGITADFVLNRRKINAPSEALKATG
jgi:excinuclease ABC subunit A